MKEKEIIVLDLGGSLVYPHKQNGPDTEFLRLFSEFIRGKENQNRRFIIVVGGGKMAREYQSACHNLAPLTKDNSLDWLGIKTTQANALLTALALGETKILDHKPNKREVQDFLKSAKKILVVSGWTPGWTTDYISARCAQMFGAKEVIVVSDTAYVCEQDPRIDPDARKIPELAWNEYLKLIPRQRTPGMSVPFDIVATRLAMGQGISVKMVNGHDWQSFSNALNGLPFNGTTIHP